MVNQASYKPVGPCAVADGNWLPVFDAQLKSMDGVLKKQFLYSTFLSKLTKKPSRMLVGLRKSRREPGDGGLLGR